MRHALRTAAVVLALSTAAACSSDEQGPVTAAASPSPSAAGGTFASTDAIIAAMGRGGLPCDAPERGVFEGAAEAQRCVVLSAEDVIVLRFEDDAQKAAYLESKDELASVVVGENWAVQTVLAETARQVADAVGGEVRVGGGG